MVNEKNKPIKRVRGRYVVVCPYIDKYKADHPRMEHLVHYYETTKGWDYGFTGDLALFTKRYGIEWVLNEYGVSLQCASAWVKNYYRPEYLAIIDTETGEIVNPLDDDAADGTKVIQPDFFGNEFVWE